MNQKLTEKEIKSAVNLFGKRCKVTTKQKLRRALQAVPTKIDYGIYNRVEFKNEDCSYCAGQDYVQEIKTVRECLLDY